MVTDAGQGPSRGEFGEEQEEIFRREMEAQGGAVSTWANAPGDRYSAHSHAYRKVLCCLEGSIVFRLPDGDAGIEPGQRLEIARDTPHSAVVGPRGVRCSEAQFG